MSLWLVPPYKIRSGGISVFRCRFSIAEDSLGEIMFSADEHADLFLDGEWLAEGPARGDRYQWYLEKITVPLPAGNHLLTARVKHFGKALTAWGQETIRHGLFFESSQISGQWEYHRLDGCRFLPGVPEWGSYPRLITGRRFAPEVVYGEGDGWLPARRRQDSRTLLHRDLPPFLRCEETGYQLFHQGNRIIVKFDRYVRVVPEYRFSGSGTVEIRWAEALFKKDGTKGNRNQWQGCQCDVQPSIFRFKNGMRWFDYWYRAGRYLLISLSGNVKLEELKFQQVSYPYQHRWQARSSSKKLNRLLELAWNTFDLCSYDTFMDCPYYEQLQYAGDCRIESLISFVSEPDSRLPLKALRLLGNSAGRFGVTLSRWPTRLEQLIPAFSLFWIQMLHDYALWQDPDAIRPLLPIMRKNLCFFEEHLDADGLPSFPGWENLNQYNGVGWNFMDWNEVWAHGIPAGQCPLSCLWLLTMEQAAELEEKCAGDSTAAQKLRNRIQKTRQVITSRFLDQERKALSDFPDKTVFSEHAQVLATLSEALPNLDLSPQGAVQTGIYFSHYYLEAAWKTRNARLFQERLSQWETVLNQGLLTLPEEFTHSRSDCHAWSAHILYHYFASILGIRPRGFGAVAWDLNPLFINRLKSADGTLTHRNGNIHVSWSRLSSGHYQVSYDFPGDSAVFFQGNKLEHPTGELIIKEEKIRRAMSERVRHDWKSWERQTVHDRGKGDYHV